MVYFIENRPLPTAPDFVHSFEYEDYIFFFLRETAVEYMNCGKKVYSRVARVCKNDKGGGLAMYQTLWTSFLKSRLNCSVPGEFPFYFDEIRELKLRIKVASKLFLCHFMATCLNFHSFHLFEIILNGYKDKDLT